MEKEHAHALTQNTLPWNAGMITHNNKCYLGGRGECTVERWEEERRQLRGASWEDVTSR